MDFITLLSLAFLAAVATAFIYDFEHPHERDRSNDRESDD